MALLSTRNSNLIEEINNGFPVNSGQFGWTSQEAGSINQLSQYVKMAESSYEMAVAAEKAIYELWNTRIKPAETHTGEALFRAWQLADDVYKSAAQFSVGYEDFTNKYAVFQSQFSQVGSLRQELASLAKTIPDATADTLVSTLNDLLSGLRALN